MLQVQLPLFTQRNIESKNGKSHKFYMYLNMCPMCRHNDKNMDICRMVLKTLKKARDRNEEILQRTNYTKKLTKNYCKKFKAL